MHYSVRHVRMSRGNVHLPFLNVRQENACYIGGAHDFSGAPHWGSSIIHEKTDFVKIVHQIRLTMALPINTYTADNFVKHKTHSKDIGTPQLTNAVSSGRGSQPCNHHRSTRLIRSLNSVLVLRSKQMDWYSSFDPSNEGDYR